ncbi:MAG: adenosylcobalamin-dependent ribonucleoside-diphosphate reductase [Candidatus Melainabacteria bacterium]
MTSQNAPRLTENALTVLQQRYLLKDDTGRTRETPAELFTRVARHIAAGDRAGDVSADTDALTDAFYDLMATGAFLPNSPTLMNAGRPEPDSLAQLSACFVLPVADDLAGIFETLTHAALIHQSGGGTGFAFTRLRPQGDVVRSTMGISSGPIAFMGVFNAATDAIKQGGARRGANMGILRVDHPDIGAFIACKNDLRALTNFNISVSVPDAFMTAVKQNADWPLSMHPATSIQRVVKAGVLFEELVQSAWRTGEPGLIFLDAINRDNPTPQLGDIEATNPCGEVPLLPYEACNLGSINLGRLMTNERQIDWDRFRRVIHQSVHFLDNVITQNHYPIPQIAPMVNGNRKIGLGLMGWADVLLSMNIPYDSEEAVALAREVAAFLDYESKRASVALAQSRGAFPNFAGSRFSDPGWLTSRRQPTARISADDWRRLAQDIAQNGIRNATTTCIAPTGTISIIAGASGGIEPLFAFEFTREILDGARLPETYPGYAAVAGLPPSQRRAWVTALDIAPEWHIRMQAAFQACTDNGVSKTINFPENATPTQVAETFRLAHTLGVKGITVYRNNSRQGQPMQATPSGVAACDTASACEACD